MKTAYAYVSKDKQIEIETVSKTVRAAMVNALVVVFGKTVTQAWTEEMITAEFQQHALGKGGISTVSVELSSE